jgi:GrpB-like predicted nucleotidyltransferase (UPF0157 family)
MTRVIEVVPYDSSWPTKYQLEVNRLKQVLRDEIVSAHHIGSTSIPGIRAKPIIDIMFEVRDISKIDGYNQQMIDLGYEPRGELGIPGRRYFSREEPKDVRTHHLHVYQTGDTSLIRHIAFRDFMIAHPVDADAYARLKEELAEKFHDDVDEYIAGKGSFVDAKEKEAIAWYQSRKQ